MIEFPEAINLSLQINQELKNKKVEKVLPPTSSHKFCFFNGDPLEYNQMLSNQNIIKAEGFGIFVEIIFDDAKLFFNDGVNIRLYDANGLLPDKYQLAILFTDKSMLVFSVAMYGCIYCYKGITNNKYYHISKDSLPIISDDFSLSYFHNLIDSVKPSMTVKAFLATEQRIPGLANGVLQDILFVAKINPKRKLETLSPDEVKKMFNSIKNTIKSMIEQGGRNTEKDMFGRPGGYKVLLSKNILTIGCPNCNNQIIKETFLGGSVYYCPICQPK